MDAVYAREPAIIEIVTSTHEIQINPALADYDAFHPGEIMFRYGNAVCATRTVSVDNMDGVLSAGYYSVCRLLTHILSADIGRKLRTDDR